MAIYVTNTVDRAFLKTTLRDCYLSYLRELFFGSKMRQQQLSNMNKYLSDNYQIDVMMLLNAVANNTLITTQGEDYKLTVNENVIVVKNYTLGLLMRLVDYGNTEIRGLNIFNKAEKYIQERLQSIFTIHTLKGLNNGL